MSPVSRGFRHFRRAPDGQEGRVPPGQYVWTAPGILEAVKPGRMQGHGGTAEVSGGAA
jgi:hypothetical protein